MENLQDGRPSANHFDSEEGATKVRKTRRPLFPDAEGRIVEPQAQRQLSSGLQEEPEVEELESQVDILRATEGEKSANLPIQAHIYAES